MSPLLLCALAATVGGVAAGSTAVHGLRPNPYGPGLPQSSFAGTANGALPAAAPENDEQAFAADCHQCSERDLGYRWAVLAAVRLPGQCPHDSWAFRRGCLDYVGGV